MPNSKISFTEFQAPWSNASSYSVQETLTQTKNAHPPVGTSKSLWNLIFPWKWPLNRINGYLYGWIRNQKEIEKDVHRYIFRARGSVRSPTNRRSTMDWRRVLREEMGKVSSINWKGNLQETEISKHEEPCVWRLNKIQGILECVPSCNCGNMTHAFDCIQGFNLGKHESSKLFFFTW